MGGLGLGSGGLGSWLGLGGWLGMGGMGMGGCGVAVWREKYNTQPS